MKCHAFFLETNVAKKQIVHFISFHTSACVYFIPQIEFKGYEPLPYEYICIASKINLFSATIAKDNLSAQYFWIHYFILGWKSERWTSGRKKHLLETLRTGKAIR